MALLLGVDLFVFAHKGGRLKRYIRCSLDTLKVIFKYRPSIVFAENPSIFLNYLLILMRPFIKYKLVSDAHYCGIISSSGNTIIQKVLNFCNQHVDFVIVTNIDHANFIQSIGGNPLICEDPLPNLDQYCDRENNDKHILYICVFAIDEPYEKVFEVADLLHDDGFIINISGDYKKANINPDEYPFINFLGYLPDNEYYAQIYRSCIILDLTNFDNCLLCGAYEAMAAERPLVTSDTACIKNYFIKGTVFTKNDKVSIANAIKLAYQNRDELTTEIKTWKKTIIQHQNKRIENIKQSLGLIR